MPVLPVGSPVSHVVPHGRSVGNGCPVVSYSLLSCTLTGQLSLLSWLTYASDSFELVAPLIK